LSEGQTTNPGLECDWIAVEWAAAKLRGWAMSRAGDVLGHATVPASGSHRDLPGLIGRWRPEGGRVPVLVAGAPDAPLRPVPCPPLPDTLPGPDAEGIILIPGLSRADPPDLTRGEEVLIAGFLATAPQFDGVLCLPGRVSRWVRISAGEVVSFTSYLTGAAIEALSGSPELRDVVAQKGGATPEGAAFDTGLAEALAAPSRVLARAAGLDGAHRLSGLGADGARARLYGLMIGQEIAGAKSWWLGMEVALLGPAPLAGLYARALAAQGVEARQHDAEPALLAGFKVLRDKL